MEAGDLEKPLVVIVGPTASGKTSAAIEIAEKHGGEIICADSRTVYRHMDIGTAKPTQEERARVPHWGLDLIEPGERFTAADFKQYANEKIAEIRDRGNLPLLVGGTGLYIDGVIFDYSFEPTYDQKQRDTLSKMTIAQLHKYCHKNNVNLPQNELNKRYIVREIERKSIRGKRRIHPIENTIIVGIATKKEDLLDRIKSRTEHLFESGVVDEATILGEKYGWESEAMTGNIYPLVHAYLESRLSSAELKDKFTMLDRRLAKRQLTWFHRNKFIEWRSLSGAIDYIDQYLATTHKA